MVTVVDVFFGNLGTVGIDPAAVFPADESHGPGEFGDTGGGEVAGEFGVETRAGGAVGSELAGTDDDDHVVEFLANLPGEVGGGGLEASVRGGQGAHGAGFFVLACRCRVCRSIPGQFREVHIGIAEAAGVVHRHGFGGGLIAHVLGNVRDQQLGDVFGGECGHACGFDCLDKRIVAAHQAGAAHPSDQGVHQGGVLAPHGFRMPTVDQCIQGCLGFAISAVAAETAAVRGARNHHMQAASNLRVHADSGQSGDKAFHAPQQQAHFRFGARASIRQGAGHAGRGEGEQQSGYQGWLEHFLRTVDGGGLLRADPLDHGI